jgi:hypothetical protein
MFSNPSKEDYSRVKNYQNYLVPLSEFRKGASGKVSDRDDTVVTYTEEEINQKNKLIRNTILDLRATMTSRPLSKKTFGKTEETH